MSELEMDLSLARQGDYPGASGVKRMADTITALRAEVERLRDALGAIAGKNDLSDAPDDQIEAYARGALYECELLARAALSSITGDE